MFSSNVAVGFAHHVLYVYKPILVCESNDPPILTASSIASDAKTESINYGRFFLNSTVLTLQTFFTCSVIRAKTNEKHEMKHTLEGECQLIRDP